MVTVVNFPSKKERPTKDSSNAADKSSSSGGSTKSEAAPTMTNIPEKLITKGPAGHNRNPVPNRNENEDGTKNISNAAVAQDSQRQSKSESESESCQVLQAVLEELEAERAKRTKLEVEVANLKLQSHMQMQQEEDKKMKEINSKKASEARKVAVSALVSVLKEKEANAEKEADQKKKEEEENKEEQQQQQQKYIKKTSEVRAVAVTALVSALTKDDGDGGTDKATGNRTTKEHKGAETSTDDAAPQDLPTAREEHNSDGISKNNWEHSHHGNGEYPLHIAHMINSLFTKRKAIPTWNMTATLQLFFQDLHATILLPLNHGHGSSSSSRTRTRHRVKKVDMDKKKRIKAAIAQVYAGCNSKSFSNRLIRTDYEEILVRPILNRVAMDFAEELLRDYYQEDERDDVNSNRTGTGTGVGGGCGSKDSQVIMTSSNNKGLASLGLGHCHKKNHHLEIKQLRIERDGYLDLVDVLTSDNDAVQLSAKNAPGTLPLHATRFLEIMPWDDRSQDYISAYEQVIQWQCYDAKAQVWSDKVRLFPPAFGSLPIDKMEENSFDISGGNGVGTGMGCGGSGDGCGDSFYHGDGHGSGSGSTTYHTDYGYLGRARARTSTLSSIGSVDSARTYGSVYDAPSPMAVSSSSVQKFQNVFGSLALNILLTNTSCTHILELSRGYPLPSRGVWEWCGNWHVEGISSGATFSSFDKDDGDVPPTTECSNFDTISKSMDNDDGWTYSNDLSELMGSDNRQMSFEAKKKLKVYKKLYRKRVWQRQRVLINYPGISQATQQMLRMNAHNAKLSIAASKLTAQVQDMHNSLTQKEEEAERDSMQLMSRIAKLEKCVEEKMNEIEMLKKSRDGKEHKGGTSITIEGITKTTSPRIDLNKVVAQNIEIIPGAEGNDHGMKVPCENHVNANAANEEGSAGADTCTVESASTIEKEESREPPQATEAASVSDLPTFVGHWKRSRGGSILETMKSNVQTQCEAILPKHLKLTR